MTDKAQVIGDNLRAMRARRRSSQQKVADEIGVSRSTIANWEDGCNSVPFDKACELADLFECSLDDLAGRLSTRPTA